MDIGESMASLDSEQSLTTFKFVLWIFSVNCSTATSLGAQASTCLHMHGDIMSEYTYMSMHIESDVRHACHMKCTCRGVDNFFEVGGGGGGL